MHHGLESLSSKKAFNLLPLLIYLSVLCLAALFIAKHPKVGWDMIGYIGVIESWHTSDGEVILHQAYSAVEKLPDYGELTGNDKCQPAPYTSYRSDVAHNSAHFIQQLPILSIKPLYVVFVSVLLKAGFSYIQAFEILSAASYFLLGMLAWLWLSRYWSDCATTVFACLLIFNPEMVSVVRSTAPDGLSLVLISLGIYLLLEHSSSIWGPIVLIASIWVRPDSLILVGLLFVTCVLLREKPRTAVGKGRGKSRSMVDVIKNNLDWLLLCTLALGSYWSIQFFAHFYSWSTLFYHSFVGYLVTPSDTTVHITPRLYFQTVGTNAKTLVGNTELVVFLLMGAVALLLHTLESYRYVTACLVVAMFTHFLFFPTDSPRFHVALAFFAPISMLIACAQYVTRPYLRPNSFA
jgi:hypothetical protein